MINYIKWRNTIKIFTSTVLNCSWQIQKLSHSTNVPIFSSFFFFFFLDQDHPSPGHPCGKTMLCESCGQWDASRADGRFPGKPVIQTFPPFLFCLFCTEKGVWWRGHLATMRKRPRNWWTISQRPAPIGLVWGKKKLLTWSRSVNWLLLHAVVSDVLTAQGRSGKNISI